MPDPAEEKEAFQFYTRMHLTELTGFRASNLTQLLQLIEEVPGSCIYHHTHRFLQQHMYLSPEPPNDFSFWVNNILAEEKLGEKLAAIDTVQFPTIRELRDRIMETIRDYLKKYPNAAKKFANEGGEFHFLRSVSFVFPTRFVAHDLKEFSEILDKITLDSIYFHVFESRLRLEKGTNDFSQWIEKTVGNKKLADEIARIDPYTYSVDDLRKALIKKVKGKSV